MTQSEGSLLGASQISESQAGCFTSSHEGDAKQSRVSKKLQNHQSDVRGVEWDVAKEGGKPLTDLSA